MAFFSLDCCCVNWGGLKPHIEWVNVPVCYHPSCICQPHCEHCYDLDCHHCCCEPCCGGCCGHHCHQCCHHCPCCHCCHHCCHCCHCRRGVVTNKPPLAPRRKSRKHDKSKKVSKKKKYHKRNCFCVTPLVLRMPFFPRLW
ncbi:unnamed protein product [Pocillopora meandrina]|uniref:Uncharacterized protein n=1 Tax=Pocillopora meandrina TaxID=46732 RepID=A0AAU9WLE3_9CNID|nr:unnamed protein product [Pocillopora meandrina]